MPQFTLIFIFLIIFYWLCYYNCLNCSPFPSSTQPPTLPRAIPTPLFVSTDHTYNVFGYSISYTMFLHPHCYSVTTYLYFLISSPLISPQPLPFGNLQNVLHIHHSVSVLVCLVYFLTQTLICIHCHFIVHSCGLFFS